MTMGMMRLKDNSELDALLKRSHLKVRGDTAQKKVTIILPPSQIVPSDKPESEIEALFSQQLANTQLPQPKRNYLYLRGSKHELDFAWPDFMLGVEVQGMAHRIKEKFQRDIVKRATAQVQGWTVLEADGKSIKDGVAMEWLHQLFEMVKV